MSADARRLVRIGLIGAGRWGRNYIRTLGTVDGVALVRLASTNPESRNLIDAECVLTSDWRELTEAPDLDAVIVATPPALHAEITCAAVATGHAVLVEKPLTLDVAEAEALLGFVDEHDGYVLVDHTHLFHPAYRTLKERAAALGPVRALRTRAGNWGPFRKDTPMLWDWGSHDVALSQDLMGQAPESVTATRPEIRDVADGLGETLQLTLHFPDDVDAEIEISNLMEDKCRRFEADFDEGTLIFDDLVNDPLVFRPRSENTSNGFGPAESIAVAPTLPLTAAVRHFSDQVATDSTDLSSLTLGVEVVAVLEKCQSSLGVSR